MKSFNDLDLYVARRLENRVKNSYFTTIVFIEDVFKNVNTSLSEIKARKGELYHQKIDYETLLVTLKELEDEEESIFCIWKQK